MKFRALASISLALCLTFCFSVAAFGQKKGKGTAKKSVAAKNATAKKASGTESASNSPKVTQIDAAGLQNLLKREGEGAKPLLVNFWATWCAPCIEEFPDLMKINAAYKGKIDFITITVDDPSEIKTAVPKFLARMKAETPTYLLYTDDPSDTISQVFKNWSGVLPFTVLYDATGKTIYTREGKIIDKTLRAELDKLAK